MNPDIGALADGGGADQGSVLLIMCDDLNDWVLRPSGHPVPLCPHIDELRARSVDFQNAHCAVPVCGPSRIAAFSGLYPQTSGAYSFGGWTNFSGLDDAVALPALLRDQGFDSAGAGKVFHTGAGGDFYSAFGPGVDYGPHPWLGEGPAQFTPHPQQYLEWEGHLSQWDMHRDLNYGSLANVPVWAPDAVEGKPGASGWYYKDATPFRYESDDDRDPMPDEMSVQWAIDHLQELAVDQPFLLSVGLAKPHTPLYVPQSCFDRFPIDDVDLPPYLEGDLDDCAPTLRNRWAWGFEKFRALLAAGGTDSWREFVQAYLAAIAFVDDQIGRLVEALEASGRRSTTTIILTSDNGYHLGEKDCIQKWHLWHESTRVPFMIDAPGYQPRAVDTPVSLVDLYPTVLDLCGIDATTTPQTLEGKSLVPWIDGRANADADGAAVIAIRDDGEDPHFSVATAGHRYTRCANGEEELYDVVADPHEWRNLAASADHVMLKRDLQSRLRAHFAATRVPDGWSEWYEMHVSGGHNPLAR